MNFNDILKRINSTINNSTVVTPEVPAEEKTFNYEDETAYVMTPELELYTATVTTLLENNFYERGGKRAERIAQLVEEVSPEFVAKLAVYARTKMNLRSVPLLLLVELARVHNGDDLVSRAVDKTILRADEIMQLLACYQWRNLYNAHGAKKLARLSNQLRIGLQRAFNRFDEYQFAKYNRNSLEVKLRDALFLTHPKAKDAAQQEIFDRIVSDTLAVPYTWETKLSEIGQREYANDAARNEAFAAAWEQLIDDGVLGYMALLRNLRNILNANISGSRLSTVCNRLSNAAEVARSRQLPLRFLAAYRELSNNISTNAAAIRRALEDAVMLSLTNINGFDSDDSILVACDVSGSMYSGLSTNSSIMLYDVGLLLGMLLKSRYNNVTTGIFGTDWEVVDLPSSNILASTDKLRQMEGRVGYATNGYKVLDWLWAERKYVDKVMIFTDCQLWDSSYSGDATLRKSWYRYKAMNPNARLYLFDLAGYGNSPIASCDKDVYTIGGWSENIFNIIAKLEMGKSALDEVMQIDL